MIETTSASRPANRLLRPKFLVGLFIVLGVVVAAGWLISSTRSTLYLSWDDIAIPIARDEFHAHRP